MPDPTVPAGKRLSEAAGLALAEAAKQLGRCGRGVAQSIARALSVNR